MEPTLIEQLEEIRATKMRDIGQLGEKLAQLDSDLAAADRHIRDQILQMLDRQSTRQADIVGLLSDLLDTMQGRSAASVEDQRSFNSTGRIADQLFNQLYQQPYYPSQPN